MDERFADRNQAAIPQDVPPFEAKCFADAQPASCDQKRKFVLGLPQLREHFERVLNFKRQSFIVSHLRELSSPHVTARVELLPAWDQSLALPPRVHSRH